ncbi:hypothetical protein NM688_g6726 [Phlebia brevispora]|uniref:Uncharacterized protein n=1 Tax=Phlebia brevispora TaxID=194682 RepID=A0ACC1SDF1_9APHY|nr:hypothetical protein NM688_g6726 [Phlebia brevispora]
MHIEASPVADLFGFVGMILSMSETAIGWLREYHCGGCSVNTEGIITVMMSWVLPNVLKVLIQSAVITFIGKNIATSLRMAKTTS